MSARPWSAWIYEGTHRGDRYYWRWYSEDANFGGTVQPCYDFEYRRNDAHLGGGSGPLRGADGYTFCREAALRSLGVKDVAPARQLEMAL